MSWVGLSWVILFPPINRLVSCSNVAPSWGLFFALDVAGVPGITLDKPQSPLCVALLIDYVKPDDVIAGITSNGVLVLEADTGSSPVNG